MVQAAASSLTTTYLDQLLDHLHAFKSLLDQEALVLKTIDTEPLIKIAEQKKALSDDLDAAYQNLIAHLSPETPLSLAEIILSPIFQSLPATQQQKLQNALELSQACHSLNLSNGMTIQALSNLNGSLLYLLSGQDRNTQVYGAQGKTQSSSTMKKTLGTA